MDYKSLRGYIGTWKNQYKLYGIIRDEYIAFRDEHLGDASVIAIIMDDEMKMVLKDVVVAHLTNKGTVVEIPKYLPHVIYSDTFARKPVKKTRVEESKPPKEETDIDVLFRSVYATVGTTNDAVNKLFESAYMPIE